MVRTAKRRVRDIDSLSHAEKTRIANEIVEFFTGRLPEFIAREGNFYDLAWAEADLFRALSALPDRTLKKMGLDRAEIPALVLSTFHLIKWTDRHRRTRGRKSAAGLPRGSSRQSSVKRRALTSRRGAA
ncbi:MAG TPA: hypothetical protein VFO61_02630 [Alphaproteobacteria bacterium]|nr:hypothetical protein [Alphaproteobacteria bacterium]